MAKIIHKKSTVVRMNLTEYESFDNWKLSMSQIGDECLRRLFLDFFWASKPQKFPAKLKRTFAVGNMFEKIAVEELKRAGCRIFGIDEVTGEEFDYTGEVGEKQERVFGITGHEKGKLDGRIIGLDECPEEVCLLELKTMKASEWNKLVKHTCRISHPKYFGQVQRYMKATGLKKCFFLAINKDTSQFHSEMIGYDSAIADDYARKEIEILTAEGPPTKEFSEDVFPCVVCRHKGFCHEGMPVQENCRTCKFSDLEQGGEWVCTNEQRDKKEPLTIDEQKAGCELWQNDWYEEDF